MNILYIIIVYVYAQLEKTNHTFQQFIESIEVPQLYQYLYIKLSS